MSLAGEPRRFNVVYILPIHGELYLGEKRGHHKGFVLCQVLAQRDRLLARRKEAEPLIGVHKRVDNPGTARMQLEQRMLSTQAYLQAARTLEESFETCFVQGGEMV